MIKRIKEKLKNKKGFTLVELIVVIVIILVLSAVMVPSVLKYIDKANQANTKSDAATILTQVQADTANLFATTDGAVTPTNIPVQGVTAEYKARPSLRGKGTGKKAEYTVNLTAGDNYGVVTEFRYQDGRHFIAWTEAKGWTKIDNMTHPTPSP